MENLWNFHHIIFFFYISFQAWLFKSNGKGILKLIFLNIYYQPKGGFLTASRPLLSPHHLVNDFLIWYQTLLLCLNIVPKAYNSFRWSEKVKKRYQKKVSRFAHKCPILRTWTILLFTSFRPNWNCFFFIFCIEGTLNKYKLLVNMKTNPLGAFTRHRGVKIEEHLN